MGERTTRVGTRVLLSLASYGASVGLAVGATTPTPTTAGVASERGIVSFVVLLVLIGGSLWYLRRRRAGRTTER